MLTAENLSCAASKSAGSAQMSGSIKRVDVVQFECKDMPCGCSVSVRRIEGKSSQIAFSFRGCLRAAEDQRRVSHRSRSG